MSLAMVLIWAFQPSIFKTIFITSQCENLFQGYGLQSISIFIKAQNPSLENFLRMDADSHEENSTFHRNKGKTINNEVPLICITCGVQNHCTCMLLSCFCACRIFSTPWTRELMNRFYIIQYPIPYI